MTISPQTLEDGATAAIGVLADIIPGMPGLVWSIVKEVLPPMIGWIAAEIEGGGDPKAKLLALMVSAADSPANAAEAAKFPNG